MIDGISIIKLTKINLDAGDVYHALKVSDSGYSGFGEAYFSFIKPDFIKAWKRHTKMTMNLIVPVGEIKFIFTSDRKNFYVKEIGENDYSRVTVAPGIWFGFQGIGRSVNLLLNLSNIIHDPDESEHLEQHEIDYDWSAS